MMNELLINVFWFLACVFLIVLIFRLIKKSIEIHNTEAAFKHIKGYCEKHNSCNRACVFWDLEEEECVLHARELPCDWKEVK